MVIVQHQYNIIYVIIFYKPLHHPMFLYIPAIILYAYYKVTYTENAGKHVLVVENEYVWL